MQIKGPKSIFAIVIFLNKLLNNKLLLLEDPKQLFHRFLLCKK